MTTTNTEALAARLESGWCPIESPTDMERAAAELRRLSAVEAERDALRADAERYRWLKTHPLWSVGYRIKPGKAKEWRMREEGEYWGQWWPTHEQAVDHAMKGTQA